MIAQPGAGSPAGANVGSAAGPLSGIIVVDLTRVLAGPFCTMLLADLGARVIKVENPRSGDDSRAYGPFINGKSGYFIAQNRGKESIALDLKNPDDQAILHRLLRRADVLVENFRPGTMARLGFGQESLKLLYPQLIYAATSGFGQTGPYADRPAYDIIAQAMGGIMSLTGHEGSPPTRVGASIGDLGAGLFTALGIVSALHHRSRTGEGIAVDVAMLDSQLALLENAIARYYSTGTSPKPLGARHPSIAPFEAYEVADGHIVIACGNDPLFRQFCRAVGHDQLADDPLFATNTKRSENVVALKAAMEAFLKTQTRQYWLDLLGKAGIPSAPINDVEQAINDPQVRHRKVVLPLDDASVAPLEVAGSPIKFSAYPVPEKRPRAPDLDEDRARILADFP
ncbi:CoA:oxalate CoA-transferase [Dongia mobilis]|uniref:CoA:oxalate CoA-transferase n=1 Tax=Dongia mobilis TaxID=578943 RepID=A0A4R6WNT8_9PROT|nr:CoA transferase [Dongia mobilis]TDQ80980.1 CoA:oxalate CoA-transferase [Dongia mobilis]